MATKKKPMARSKKKKSRGFLWGLIFGIIVTVGAIYYYNNYYKKTELQKKTEKLEKNAKKQLDKAEDGVKKLFEK